MFAGRDPVIGRKWWIAKTVHGGKRVAQRELAKLIAEVDRFYAELRKRPGRLQWTTST